MGAPSVPPPAESPPAPSGPLWSPAEHGGSVTGRLLQVLRVCLLQVHRYVLGSGVDPTSEGGCRGTIHHHLFTSSNIYSVSHNAFGLLHLSSPPILDLFCWSPDVDVFLIILMVGRVPGALQAAVQFWRRQQKIDRVVSFSTAGQMTSSVLLAWGGQNPHKRFNTFLRLPRVVQLVSAQ